MESRVAGWLGLKLGLTYRYDNLREGITGWNPAKSAANRENTAQPRRRTSPAVMLSPG